MLFLISLVFLFLVLFLFYYCSQNYIEGKPINPTGKYVLITGCDTGFGHSFAIDLDKQGFNVLAAVYNEDNGKSLAEKLSSNATVFRVDITSEQDINSAFNLVKSKTNSLYGLINNAGIADFGLIDWISMKTMRQIFDVNLFGHVLMTKTFLPLLIAEPDSRVVNISSAAGFLAAAGASSYSCSKYALEAFSDCLRREMAIWNLRVSIIEPGFMRTPIIHGIEEKMTKFWNLSVSDEAKQRWGDKFFREWVNESIKITTESSEDPIKVVYALRHAIGSTKPRIRYRPGWQASLLCFPLSMAPTCFVDYIIGLGQRKMPLPDGLMNKKLI